MDYRSPPSAPRPRILLATEARTAPRDCVEFAHELVMVAGAELVVSRLEPNMSQFATSVAESANETGAKLILVPAREHSGQRTNEIVQAARIPVFVVSSGAAPSSVLAATSVRYADFPVLRGAAEIARALGASLAALHNIAPPYAELHDETRASRLHACSSAKERVKALIQATHDMKVHTVVITRMLDTVEAILHEAELRDASLIVAGAHLSQRRGRNAASIDLVNLARRSVLLVPLASNAGQELEAGDDRVHSIPVPRREMT